MWILSLGTLISILIGMFPLQSVENPASQLAHAFYFSMHRNSWAIAIAWIIFSCEMGRGGIIKKFLELPLWRPTGRMSLSFYLIHTIYIIINGSPLRVPFWFNDFQMVKLIFNC